MIKKLMEDPVDTIKAFLLCLVMAALVFFGGLMIYETFVSADEEWVAERIRDFDNKDCIKAEVDSYFRDNSGVMTRSGFRNLINHCEVEVKRDKQQDTFNRMLKD